MVKVISDRSGFEHKREDCIKEWNGMIVHKNEYEPRHPQDFVTGRADNQSIIDARPETPPEFVGLYGKIVKPEDL